MSNETPNAIEMHRKRGRPAKTEAPARHDGNYKDAEPTERLVALVLRRGWWPYEGAKYRDEDGKQQTYSTPEMADGTVNETARKRAKFLPGARIEVPPAMARTLVEEGKATLDVDV